jgi:hypothetical protein
MQSFLTWELGGGLSLDLGLYSLNPSGKKIVWIHNVF